MSLESQVAALVTASNTLTNEVTGKQATIDASVAAAVAAVPNLYATIYVDNVAGVDTNAGTQANPIKTIDEALTRTKPVTNIYLMSGQTHTLTIDRLIQNTNLSILNYGTGANPILTHSTYTNTGPTPNTQRSHGMTIDNASIRFVTVDIKTAINPTALTIDWGFSGFIMLSGYAGGVIQIESCGVTLQDFKFYGQPNGRAPTSFNVYGSVISRISPQGLTPGLCEFESTSTGAFAQTNSTLLGGLVWSDLVKNIIKDANGALRNITTSVASL